SRTWGGQSAHAFWSRGRQDGPETSRPPAQTPNGAGHEGAAVSDSALRLLYNPRENEMPMAREHIVTAKWDDEADVWVATSDDVPGLVTESKTFEALLKKLRTLVPELLALNGAMPRS